MDEARTESAIIYFQKQSEELVQARWREIRQTHSPMTVYYFLPYKLRNARTARLTICLAFAGDVFRAWAISSNEELSPNLILSACCWLVFKIARSAWDSGTMFGCSGT